MLDTALPGFDRVALAADNEASYMLAIELLDYVDDTIELQLDAQDRRDIAHINSLAASC